jgi:hypothetical protein
MPSVVLRLSFSIILDRILSTGQVFYVKSKRCEIFKVKAAADLTFVEILSYGLLGPRLRLFPH